MPEQKKFYLTTPIYYVNARPHIGHAYTTLTADTIARRKRLEGYDVRFLTGTDEHGQKIQRSADAAGIAPQQFADEVSASFRSLWERMGITYDDYIRTTEPRHKQGVQKLFSTLKEKGYIYLDSYTGQYCVSDEAFVEVGPGEPCPDCGRITETITEENYYFRLSAFQEELINRIESDDPDYRFEIEPAARKNEVLSFLRGDVSKILREEQAVGRESGLDGVYPASLYSGIFKFSKQGNPFIPGSLKDLSISRTSFKWGIPVPGDEKHVIYVWLDALANYMTALGYGSAGDSLWQKYWPADLHLVGKEIIRFHCVYWPAFLLAAELPLPKKVQAHGWLLFEESKMSKSRGNIVRSETILDAFGSLKPELGKAEQDLFATDVLRYFLLREIPFGQDGSFSFDALVTRYNADLANGYGNLVSRTLSMIAKNFDGEVPAPLTKPFFAETLDATSASVASDLNELVFTRAVTSIASAITSVDRYFSESEPWKLAKVDTQREELASVLYNAAEAIRIITALLYPFLPYATARVWEQLGLGDIGAAAKSGELNNLVWGGLKPGTKLGTLAPIFPRADKELITRMNEAEQQNRPAAVPAEAKAEGVVPTTDDKSQAIAPPADTVVAEEAKQHISIDDFIKVELRAAVVKVAERIPKADKLLRLEVDLGDEQRQILSGIAEWYTPEELIGRRIIIVANLAPRKMRGLESHGMLLAASEGENGKPMLATFAEDVTPGTRLK
ncbi:MAG: methionine--tRNA ligase subunit beta [Acidobacteria bacterium]|nr:methionine--tRNA ligase subunit beta [Acidobacteriota bacterium]